MSTGEQLNEFNASLEEARQLLEKVLNRKIDLIELQQILVDVLGLESELYLFDRKLTAKDIVDVLLSNELEKKLAETEVIILEKSIFPAGVLSPLDEEIVKYKNQIWKINKSDADPKPSNPHGANIETGIKLDLSNGKLYRKTTEVGQIRKKDLENIRGKMRHIVPPPLSM